MTDPKTSKPRKSKRPAKSKTRKASRSYEERCFDLEEKARRKCGWGPGAWVGVVLAPPSNPSEEAALSFVQKHWTNNIYVDVQSIVGVLSRELKWPLP